MIGKMHRTFRLAIAGMIVGLAATAQAGNLLVAGSPGYDPVTHTGFGNYYNGGVYVMPGSGVNNSGTVVGYSEMYQNFNDMGLRAVRWDASGKAATELGNLGTDSSGTTNGGAYAVNDAGTAVGYSYKYVGGRDMGTRAVRWDASGTAATELGNLGTDSNGITYAYAYAVNNTGTAVGYSYKYIGSNDMGSRAVRWDASGTAATELGNLGTDSSGFTLAAAYAVNAAGTSRGVLK